MTSNLLHVLLIGLGLSMFEIISSIDNAVVNAGILATIRSQRSRMMFFIFGGFFAVVVVRVTVTFVVGILIEF